MWYAFTEIDREIDQFRGNVVNNDGTRL